MKPTHRHALSESYRRPGGPWDVPTLDVVLGTARPRKSLLVDGKARIGSVELNQLEACVAAGLRERGVRRGDVVAWQLPNRWEAVVLYRACWRLGAVAAPIHHLAGTGDVEVALAQVQPRVVVEPADLPALLASAPLPTGFRPARPADVAVVLLTSGSSGTPKAVMHTHRGLAHKALLMAGVHGLKHRDAVLMPAPLAHVSGLLNAVLLPGALGMRTVLQQRWDPDRALELIEAERVSFMVGPPTFFLGLREAATFEPAKVASMRLVSSGGTGVTPDFVRSTADALGCTVKRTYGSTEAPTVATAHHGDKAKKGRTTDGRATGEVELRLDPGTGELLVRGPEVFAGYTDPERTADAFARGGWFRTGDLARIDDSGWLTITGRLKDVIIRGGENIATAEVEAVCESHPDVRQAVAVGFPDRRLGERVAVVVVLAPGSPDFDLEVCRAWFAQRGIAKFRTPEHVEVLDELPLLAAGKPDRAALAALVGGAAHAPG